MRSPLQQRVSQPWDWSPQKQVGPQGFSGLCHLTKASLSKEAWGGRKCHTGLRSAPTKSAIVLGGSRDLPHILNVTRRVGALLSSQRFWGIIVGSERAGKTSAESVGGRKATLQAGNTSDVWENYEMSFPWSEELGWVIYAGGRRAALLSRTPPHAQRCLWQQLSWTGIATLSPLWMSYSISAICLQWEVIM